MRIIALEEHMATPDVIEAWRRVEPRWRDVGFQHSSSGRPSDALLDLDAQRLAAMDESEVDVQVLSLDDAWRAKPGRGGRHAPADAGQRSARFHGTRTTRPLPSLRDAGHARSCRGGGSTAKTYNTSILVQWGL